MQWIIAIGVFALLMLLLPAAVRVATKSTRGKGGLGGASLAIGIAFAFIFDPPKAAAIENIQKEEETGDAEKDTAGRKLDAQS